MAAPDRPWFLWDVDVSDAVFRERLKDPDPRIRAQWQGKLLREARVEEVWRYLSLTEILANWEFIRRHLGRRRPLWDSTLNAWREHGFIPAR